tara:strand:+ start:4552 stop:6405 length:1854 start_codon:yes stop_codon:yes gene_type:complete
MLNDLIEFLFYKPGDKKELDTQKVAGLLGLGVGLSGGFEPYRPKVGYQGSIPNYTAVREPVNIPYSPNRRPGSGGRRYFSDLSYVPEGGDMESAQLGASQQATDLGLQNLQNFNSYPPFALDAIKKSAEGVTAEETEKFDMGPYKLAETKPIPGVDDAISSGIIGLSGQKGLASGGIAGYKHGGFHLTDPSTYMPSLKKAGQSITDGIAGVFGDNEFVGATEYTYPGGVTLSAPQDKPDNENESYTKYTDAYGTGDLAKTGGYGNILDPSTFSMKNLKEGFTKVGDADQRAAYEALTFDDKQRIMGTYQRDPFGGDKDPDPVAGTPGGARPNIAGMTPEQAQAYIKTMGPTTKGYTGDYSDLDTFKNYTFGDPNFTFDDFKKAAEIAGYGKKDQLASDTNVVSGAGEGTYRQTGSSSATQSIPSNMPASVSALGLNLDADNIGSYTSLSNEYASLSPKKQAEAIDNFSKIADGTIQASISPQMAANTRAYLQQLSAMKKDQLNKFLADIKAYGDLLGVGGQQGIGMNVGGLLKSSEDGMTDTLPAQVGPDPVMLSGGEYIMDAEIVSMLGNGNTDAGAKVLDDFRENVRGAKHGGKDQGDQINPENFMSRLAGIGVA